MSTFIKVITAVLIMNTFLYLGINYGLQPEDEVWRINGDLMDTLYRGNLSESVLDDKNNGEVTNEVGISSDISSAPSQKAGEPIGSGDDISYLDALKIFFSFVGTLFNIAIAPVTIFSVYSMPFMVRLLIGFPLAIIELLSLILLLRGVSG